MKVVQLREVLELAEKLYRDGGHESVAQSLREMVGLMAGRENMTVSNFARLIAKAAEIGRDSLDN